MCTLSNSKLRALIAISVLIACRADAADGGIRSLADLDLLQLREIPIVSAARREQSREDSPRAVAVITAEEIRRRNIRSVPEAVAGLAGVFLQQTNYAGGSPIIRGMVGNRILIMVNGIRLNNGAYRMGPNQYLNSIDIHQVDRIEVVRGSGSVQYGSDALGGVINVITKAAPDPLTGGEFQGTVGVRFASQDRSGSGRLEAAGTSHGLGFRAGYTREGFGDLRAGGLGTQRFTGYGQSSGDLTLRHAFGPAQTLVIGMTRLEQRGVDRTDVLRAGTDLEYIWDMQGRDMVYAQYSHAGLAPGLDAIEVTLAYQRPTEYARRILAASPYSEQHQTDEVNSGQFTLQFTSTPGSRQIWTYGFESNSDRIRSRRMDANLQSGVQTGVKGNVADASRYGNWGVFFQDEIEIGSRWKTVIGLRRDQFRLHADTTDGSAGAIHINAHPAAVTGSGYVLAKIARGVSGLFGISEGFRAPSVDDSTVFGGSGGRFEIPNSALNPERNTSFEYGLRSETKHGSASVVYYSSRYRGLIDRTPALWNGLAYLDGNGNGKKDSNELSVYTRQNIGRAIVRGVEAEAAVRFSEDWTWSGTATWTYGQDFTANTPLTRIPPLNGVSRLAWQATRSLWLEAEAYAAAGQHRLSASDVKDIRIGSAGTAGFAVFHLRGGLNRTPLAGLSVAWENLTNRKYRLHGSGFERPGRGIVVGYQRGF